MRRQENARCPACRYAAMPIDADLGDLVTCPTCGVKLRVYGSSERDADGRTCSLWLVRAVPETRAGAAEAALRTVADMGCSRSMARATGEDCRARYREAMGGRMTPEEQRANYCPRCVAADALESLPEK